jgi:HEAT repeat protein
MPAPLSAPSAPTVVAWVAVLATVGSSFGLARAVRRHGRRIARDDARVLELTLDDHLRGQIDAAALRAIVRHADPATFWTALERISIGLTRDEWDRLSRTLEHNRHSAAERRALRDDSPWRRELAARRVGLLRSTASCRSLRAALACGPRSITRAAAVGLARARDARTLKRLLAEPAVLGGMNPRVRAQLLRSFGRAAAPVMLARLTDDPETSLMGDLIEALGLLGHQAAAPAIASCLGVSHVEVRVAAARALGRLGARDQTVALTQALYDPEWPVRAQAARALGRAGDTESAAALAHRLADASWWVRRNSAYALAALGEPGRETLRRIVASSPDAFAREMATEALEHAAPRQRA